MFGQLSKKESKAYRLTKAIDGARRRLTAMKLVGNQYEIDKITKEIQDLEKRRERVF